MMQTSYCFGERITWAIADISPGGECYQFSVVSSKKEKTVLKAFGNRRPAQRLFFFISETAKSQARAVKAMYVSDGFTHEADVMHAPSDMKRFFASCAWLCSFKTEVLGSRPMRAVPIS